VLLVDDHTVVRRGLRRILESQPGISVVGEAGESQQAVAAVHELTPDVVLMDVGLPGVNGIETTRAIVQQLPQVRVLILSMYSDAQYVVQSRSAGACGYLVKDADDGDVVAAVLAAARGEEFFSRHAAADTTDGAAALSGRERAVLALIADGLANRAIAERLGISVNTVETHRKHIMEKLDLHGTADLVRFAVRHGLATPNGD